MWTSPQQQKRRWWTARTCLPKARRRDGLGAEVDEDLFGVHLQLLLEEPHCLLGRVRRNVVLEPGQSPGEALADQVCPSRQRLAKLQADREFQLQSAGGKGHAWGGGAAESGAGGGGVHRCG